MGRATPVTNDASSLARKRATRAGSIGSASRPIGWLARTCCSTAPSLLAESLRSVVALTSPGHAERGRPYAWGAPLRRAFELIRERFVTALSLDEIALHAGLDIFQLIRAFRGQLGVTPYAYVTQLRVGRARALLTRGVPPSEIAARVGLYDQSQLNRHFKRIVGITPGQFARAVV
jgi:AraC-like DNA-binding protein